MLKKMNRKVDPCSDFYEYACGNWINQTKLPNGFDHYHPIFKLGVDVFTAIREDFEEHLSNPKNSTTFDYPSSSQAKTALIYQSCVDENLLKQRNFEPLKNFTETIGGWGLLESEDDNLEEYLDWDFETALESLYNQSIFPLIFIQTTVDDKNTSRHVITVEQPQLTLPQRKMYVNETANEIYGQEHQLLLLARKLVLSTLEQLGGNGTIMEDRAMDLVKFEASLALAMDTEAIKNNISVVYSLQTVDSVQKIATFMNWTRFLGRLFEPSGVPIRGDTKILVKGIHFLRKLSDLIQSYKKTPWGSRTLDDYMKWRSLITFVSFLDHSFYPPDIQRVIKVLLRGRMPRWIYCMNRITEIASQPLSSIYLPKLRNRQKIKNEVFSLTENIIKSLKKEIQSLTWMDERTKLTALSKVKETESLVGYPEQLLNLTAIDDEYQSLNVQPMKYFENMVAGLKFYRMRNIRLLGTVPLRDKWSIDLNPIRANAYYSFKENRIILPMAILAPQLFVSSAPDYINFGSIGSIIGHELTHGFDDRGRTYGEYGNIRPWWSTQASKEYFKRSQCLIDQYSGMEYTFPGGHRVVAQQKQSKNRYVLPGLNMTATQIFFLSFAQTWCAKASPTHYRYSKANDVHALERFRVIGPLQNMPEFSDAFSCPVGSKMNPSHKCASLW